MTEKEAYIAFNLTEGVGSVKLAGLVSMFGSVASAWENYPHKTGRIPGVIDWERELKLASKYKVEILTPADDDYPAVLKEMRARPLALYVKGDVKAISRPAIAMVGTRRSTEYGRNEASKLSFDLASNGWAIISGLALGIDAAAHRGALDASGVTVGVLGSALDMFYPDENRSLAREIIEKGGAVVSEFPFGRGADEHTFPQRNRVVAALSKGVIAIEAPAKSGTLITTSLAAELGRMVMALPGRVDSRASAVCLKLIRDGARLVRNARDVEEEMGDLFGRSALNSEDASSSGDKRKTEMKNDTGHFADVPFNVDESIVMRNLGDEPLSVDVLAAKTGFDIAKINSITMSLRLKGRLRFFPGNRVALPRSE
jgi:DNA processing protein